MSNYTVKEVMTVVRGLEKDIKECEQTLGMFGHCVKEHGWPESVDKDKRPVVQATWKLYNDFSAKLNTIMGQQTYVEVWNEFNRYWVQLKEKYESV